MQHIIGVILLGLDGLLATITLLLLVTSLSARRAKRTRRRIYGLFPEYHAFNLAGTVASAPTLQTLLSHEPCVLWGFDLYERIPSSNESPAWQPIWSKLYAADLVITYDIVIVRMAKGQVRREIQPGSVRISGDVVGGGMIEGIPMDSTVPWNKVNEYPLTPELLTLLNDNGLPDGIRESIKLPQERAYLERAYMLAESCLSTGAFVQGSTLGESPPTPDEAYAATFTEYVRTPSHIPVEQFVPDPQAKFVLVPSVPTKGLTTCLFVVFLVVTLLTLIFAIALLNSR